MGRKESVVIPEHLSGKTVSEMAVKGGAVEKGGVLLSCSDGSSLLSEYSGIVSSSAVSVGGVLEAGSTAFELEIEENVSSVAINERTAMLSKMLADAVASSSIQVMENGRLERKPLSFSIQNEKLTVDDVCAPAGLMSLFVLSASDFFNDAFRRQEGAFPVVYYYDKNALMEVVPYFPSPAKLAAQGVDPNIPDMSFATIAHMLHFALEDYVEKTSSPEMLVEKTIVPLDPLFQKWYEARQSYKVSVYNPVPVSAPANTTRMSG